MSDILNRVHKNIDQSLKTSYTATLTLAMTVDHLGSVENFDTIASKLIKTNPNIDLVQLAPDGVIKYIYPLKGNEVAMNYDVLNTPKLYEESQKAITLNNIYFAGPLQLKQGGIGVVGRYPIYKKNKFWGFSAVVIKLNTLLESAGIKNIDTSKYYFQFSKINPNTKKEDFFLANPVDFFDKQYDSISFPDGDWKLYIINKNTNYLIKDLAPYIFISLLMSSLFSLIVILILKKPSELQLLAKKQEENLVKNEVKYQTIFNQATIGIAQVDCCTDAFIEVNEQYCKLLGLSREEVLKMGFKQVTDLDGLDENLLSMQQLKSGAINKFSFEKKYINKSDKNTWVNITVSPFLIENEKPNAIIAIVEDITLRKKAEEAIKKSELQFKSLFNDSPIALWEEDLSEIKNYLEDLGLMLQERKFVENYFKENPQVTVNCIRLVKVINVNKECLNLHGVKSKKELLQNFSKILEETSLNSLQKILIGITQLDKRGGTETEIITSKGEYRNISLIWNVVRGFEKSYERVIISTEDITSRKKSEKFIVESQQKIESLINTIDGIVWECDAKTFEFSFISKKLENILGYTVEEWMGSLTFWADHIYPEDREWAIDYCSAQTRDLKQHDFEYRMIAKDGRIVWLRDIVNVIVENDGTVNLRGIMIDITKSKDAEMDLNNSFSLVSEQNKRLLNFSYIVSHNLRSHSSNLQSLSSLIMSSDSEKERDELIKLLGSVSNALNETMYNLNEVVNIQTNINLNIEPLNLKLYVQKSLEVLSEQIKLKKVTINCNIEEEITVLFNPAYLESVLMNCISNAIRYSDPEKESYIDINSHKENNATLLEISDNGIGIDMDKNRDKIFGMYKTFNNNPDAKGMGLFITKSQIDAMEGRITVDSKLKEGTTFKIYFR